MNAVDKIMPSLSEEAAAELNDFLESAPRWLMESMQSESIKKGTVFMSEGDPLSTVYILLRGEVTATDLRIEDARYDYMVFRPIEVFGAMEFLAGIDTIQTTLYTSRDSLFLKASAKQFERWMQQDIHALLIQTRKMTSYLLDQGRTDRLNLFLQGEERIYHYFTRMYDQTAKDGTCVVAKSLDEIGKATGLSIRTVNRSVSSMVSKNAVTREGRRFVISEKQYHMMKKYLDEKIRSFSD